MAGRQDPDALADKSLVLIFIAASVRESDRAESALTSAGIDYCVELEEFAQGLLSFRTRAGLGFYVAEDLASLAREVLTKADLQSGLIGDE